MMLIVINKQMKAEESRIFFTAAKTSLKIKGFRSLKTAANQRKSVFFSALRDVSVV